ncbi:hypothetical protein KIW84_070982, partial [Lathyrus oleraceus]
NTFLLPRDILTAADHLIRMKFGMGTLDDMNHLKNKRIRSIADLLQDQFGLALVRLEHIIRGTICGAIRSKLRPTPQNLVTSTPLTTTYESFFGLHPLSQVLDLTNPLTQIVHEREKLNLINSIYTSLEQFENDKNKTIHFEQQRAINQVQQSVFQQALQGALGTLNSCLNNELHLRTIGATIGMFGSMKAKNN